MSGSSGSDAAQPELGVPHALRLGDSFLGARNHSDYASLRYDFKPASLAGSGVYRLQPGNKVSLHLPSSNAQFSGKLEPCKGDLDCVAIFDGTSWRLELLSANIITKYHRGTGAALAATPELLSANTSCPSSDQPGGLGNDLFASDDEVEGAGPRPPTQQQPAAPATKLQQRPSTLSQPRPVPAPSTLPQPQQRQQQQAAGSSKASAGKRPAAGQGQARPGEGPKRNKADEAGGKQPSRLQGATPPGSKGRQGGRQEPAQAAEPEPEELDLDAAFDEVFADDEPDVEEASPEAPALARQPSQQSVQHGHQQVRRDVPAAKPSPPAPAAPVAAPRPAPPPAAAATPPLQPASKPAPSKPQPAVQQQQQRQPKPQKPAPTKQAKAAADEWGFGGMDDDDDEGDANEHEEEEVESEEEEPAPAPQRQQQQQAAPVAQAQEEEEEEEWEEVAPAAHRAQAAAPPAVQAPYAAPSNHVGDYEDDEDDDAHLRCSDDEASDGLGMEDGLC